MANLTFNEAKAQNFEKLALFTPVVLRVHGKNHPEFAEVKALWDQIADKTEAAGDATPDLDAEFTQLRAVTSDYTVPGDVCESYEAVYNMLEVVDAAYQG
ncbi:iron-sulfur cluster repair di-iron protein, ric [Fundicoccus culcitae]|uniref:Iron-sulfur cluster repair di-iron protein, ric n=1 Tax=Fundicoccus culcitae TaxID=2969821 RepID=A0ABY5P4Z4_9LACT|nr:iron-sulfur cluster repair di-iron protein, ric [Fundicoccus culcitae]UUX33498.1 iron-sulfur cluster repair di-iron protein, ric [Fundicoccus culcitae]